MKDFGSVPKTDLRVLLHASEILTGVGIAKADGRRPREEQLGRIDDGAIVYSVRMHQGREIADRLIWVGKTAELPKICAELPSVDLGLAHAVVPGLIDSHTHLVFAGDRASEFAARCGGATYQEIAAQGGGIQTTVRATRDATEDELLALGRKRLDEAWSFGTRTIEIKSGYGLSIESEFKVLRVIRRLKEERPEMTIVTTFLGAHDYPKDRKREEYLDELVDVMLPRVVTEGLADFCDVFIDEGYYTREEGRRILAKANALGLRTKVHADELVNTESAALASEMGSFSADHLLKVSNAGIAALAGSITVATLLPGTAFYLKAPHAPARKLIDAGARVAISTDFNPGTCMTLNLPAVLTISALYLGMTRAELFAAVTYNAALSLGLEHRKGTIEPGKDADFTILPFARFEESYYRFGWAPGLA